MAPDKPDRKEPLLELHLDQLTAEDRAWLVQELDRRWQEARTNMPRIST